MLHVVFTYKDNASHVLKKRPDLPGRWISVFRFDLVTNPLHRMKVKLKAHHWDPSKALQAFVECLLALLGQNKNVHLIFNQFAL